MSIKGFSGFLCFTRKLITFFFTMAFDLVFKDLGELESRLFDHRPVLQGDINYFLREFEDKRGHRDVVTLDKCREEVTLMQDLYLPGCLQQAEICLTDIAAKTNMATQICERICNKEHKTQTDYLQDRRAKRGQQWVDFMTEQYKKSAEVDKQHDDEINKLKLMFDKSLHQL